MTETKWPLCVVERYYHETGWVIIPDSLSGTKGETRAAYKRTNNHCVQETKDETNPREGDCRLSQCRIEVEHD